MTPLDSRLRLVTYLVLAVCGNVLATIDNVDFTDAKEIVKFGIGVIIALGTTFRSYIDKSPAQVETPKTP